MTLENEFQYYLDHQADFVERYEGKVIVLKDRKVVGSYNSEGEAVREALKRHEIGSFLVQRCEAGDQAYTRTFHSHVSISPC